MRDELLRDRPRPRGGLLIFFWVHIMIIAVGGALFGPVLTGRWLLLVVGWLVVAGLIYFSLWQWFMKPEYVVTSDELRIYHGPGAPERYHLSRVTSVKRQGFTLGSLRRFRANRWRDGVEIRIDGLWGAYWLSPTDVGEFIRIINEA
jgi:hypothetical protein